MNGAFTQAGASRFGQAHPGARSAERRALLERGARGVRPAEALARFAAERPGVGVELREETSLPTLRNLLEGRADLGIVTTTGRMPTGLLCVPAAFGPAHVARGPSAVSELGGVTEEGKATAAGRLAVAPAPGVGEGGGAGGGEERGRSGPAEARGGR